MKIASSLSLALVLLVAFFRESACVTPPWGFFSRKPETRSNLVSDDPTKLLQDIFKNMATKEDVEKLGTDVENLRTDVENLRTDVEKLSKDTKDDMDKLGGRIDKMDGRIDKMDGRIDKIDGRLIIFAKELNDVTRKVRRIVIKNWLNAIVQFMVRKHLIEATISLSLCVGVAGLVNFFMAASKPQLIPLGSGLAVGVTSWVFLQPKL